MEILTTKFKANPNEMVASVYSGVASGGRTVTTIVKPSADRQRMETTSVYGPGLQRGQGGQIGVLVLGGMVTTLAEMQYILQAKQEKKLAVRRTPSDIVSMCRLLAERRNEQIEAARKYAKANPSERPTKKRTVRLHLPVGVRYVQTREPGLKVLMGV